MWIWVTEECSEKWKKGENRFLQLVVGHPAFSKDKDLQKVLKEENDLDEEFQKKRDFVEEYTSLTKETYGDLVEEFLKKKDFVEEYTPLTKETYGNFTKMVNSQQGVALAVNDLSSGIMTASTGDDNSTKELKGTLFQIHAAKKEMCFCRMCKLVEFENATKALEKAKPKNQEMLQKAKDDAEEA
ncbi:sorting nexin-6-like [Pocillopora verrucosa]|uniref:sorting nexin-6-like n=1 Tax=Pocillopora verrucosa TaxID=203993 RepID=UPI00333EBA39